MTFTEKQKLAEECSDWMTKNDISLTPFNVITFLDCKGMINSNISEDAEFDDIKIDDPFERKIIDWVHKNPSNTSQTIRAIMVVVKPLLLGIAIAGMIISIIKTGGRL